jgi:hypothetical protein
VIPHRLINSLWGTGDVRGDKPTGPSPGNDNLTFGIVLTVCYDRLMPDAVDEARSLLKQRRTELTIEVERIDKALDALTPMNGASVQLPAPATYQSLRSLILDTMNAEDRDWSPSEMAAFLEESGRVRVTEATIRSIRTTFWALRNEGLADSEGEGRNMRTFAVKWVEGSA